MESRISKIEAKLEENNKTTYRVFEAIYGNGKPGLIAEVRELKVLISEHKKSHNGLQNIVQWIITSLIAITAIIVAIIK